MRFERKQPKGHIIKRDREIVEAVYEARYMTNNMIQRLFFGKGSNVRRRTRLLFDRGFIKKRGVEVNHPDIYYLGLLGRRYIAKSREIDQAYVDRVAGVKGSLSAGSELQVVHDLKLSTLYVEARIEAKAYGWELDWRNARMLELQSLGIQPDAYLKVSHGLSSRQAFLEYTDQMPSGKEMDGKLARYAKCFESGMSIPVLWFTTTLAKANRLLDWIGRDPYKGFYAVGLVESKGRFLTGPIWKRVGGGVESWVRRPA